MDDTSALTPEQIFWFLTAAYIGHAVELIDPKMEARLDGLFQKQNVKSWRKQVEEGLGIDSTFIRSIYALCTERNSADAAIGFILRGLGCPNGEVDARIREMRGLGVAGADEMDPDEA